MSSSRGLTPSRKKVRTGPESQRKQKESFEALHPSLPRPPSFPSLPALRAAARASSKGQPEPGPSKLSARAARPGKNLTQQSSTSSLASATRSVYGDPETSFDSSTSADEDHNEIPTRRGEFTSTKSYNNLTPLASTASLYRLHEEEDGKRENVVVCLRVRPTRQNATPIYNYKPDQDRIIFADQHPTFLKRGAMTKAHGTLNKDEYDFKFGNSSVSKIATKCSPCDSRRSPPCSLTYCRSVLSSHPASRPSCDARVQRNSLCVSSRARIAERRADELLGTVKLLLERRIQWSETTTSQESFLSRSRRCSLLSKRSVSRTSRREPC